MNVILYNVCTLNSPASAPHSFVESVPQLTYWNGGFASTQRLADVIAERSKADAYRLLVVLLLLLPSTDMESFQLLLFLLVIFFGLYFQLSLLFFLYVCPALLCC